MPRTFRDVRAKVNAAELRRFLRWFDSPIGRALIARESPHLLQGVRRFHGDTLLWLGPVAVGGLDLDRCMVRHRVVCALSTEQRDVSMMGTGTSLFCGRPDSLPFASGSIDAVVLHHALECAGDRRSAVREIYRVLRPGGRLLVCAFNPYSLWGLRRLYAGVREDAFSGTRFVSPHRLLDWLAVLGFEVDEGVRYLMYRPPVDVGRYESPRWLRVRAAFERARLPLGGVYSLLARKTAIPLTLIRAGAQTARQPQLVPLVPKPTARDRS
jgi:SAM-dependent methyltransferase